MHEDFDRCYRAVQSKDARFDGWFVTAVVTTKIYCRPSCPGPPPYARNMRFYPTAAAAQQAGFRPCKRCRPDAAPGSPEWDLRGDVVGRAMRLIADGCVDREGVTGLARRLGYSTRQLERVLVAEVGAGPLAVARAQRAQTARLLIETTVLPFSTVAFAAGFSSVRQFNDTVRTVFDTTPTLLRGRARGHRSPAPAGPLAFRLPFRAPFAPESLFAHLAGSAIPGCEEHEDGAYRRTLRLPGGNSIVSLAPTPDHVACTLALDDVHDLPTAMARCRRLLDLDADPEAVVDQLGSDSALGPLVHKAPGRRIPRTVDEHELAIRVVLSQHVSAAAARASAARLVRRFGTPVADPRGSLTHVFPLADELAATGARDIGVTRSRHRCLGLLVGALADGTLQLDVGTDWQRARSQLAGIPGMDAGTIEMIAMQGLGDPDAFPSTDPGIRTAAAALGLPRDPPALAEHAERWRPWRSYAAQYLWATLDPPTAAPLTAGLLRR